MGRDAVVAINVVQFVLSDIALDVTTIVYIRIIAIKVIIDRSLIYKKI